MIIERSGEFWGMIGGKWFSSDIGNWWYPHLSNVLDGWPSDSYKLWLGIPIFLGEKDCSLPMAVQSSA